MSDEKPIKKVGGYKERLDGKPRARGGAPAKGTRAGMHAGEAPAPDKKAAARALYEGNPGATCATVAEELGVPWPTVKRWKANDGQAGRPWKPCARTLPDLAGRAAELANSFRIKMTELGKPLSDEVAAAEVAKEVSTQHAVDVRAAVLDRHRKEWAAPRALAYKVLQQGHAGKVEEAYALGKLAKIASETLQIIQVGESRAFGLDHAARGADGGTVVVIERGGASEPHVGQMDPPAELAEFGRVKPEEGGEDSF